jgi:hypothetical protein
MLLGTVARGLANKHKQFAFFNLNSSIMYNKSSLPVIWIKLETISVWHVVWLSKWNLPRRSILPKYHTVHGIRVNVISLIFIRKLRDSIFLWSRNSQILNELSTAIKINVESRNINPFFVGRLRLMTDRFIWNSQISHKILWKFLVQNLIQIGNKM